MKQSKLVTVKKRELQIVREMLGAERTDGEDIAYSVTVEFEDGYFADIKVCNGEPPYVDPVLFDPRGCEVAVGDADAVCLEGDYHFHLGDDVYVAQVRERDER